MMSAQAWAAAKCSGQDLAVRIEEAVAARVEAECSVLAASGRVIEMDLKENV